MTVGPRRDEGGAALVAVLLLGAVLAVVAGAATARTVALVRAADAAVAREQALAAAEATVLAVLDRLERDDVGWSDPGGPDPGVLGHGWRDLDGALAGMPAPEVAGRPAVRLDVVRVGEGPTLRIRAEGRVGRNARAVEVLTRPESVADLAWGTVHAVIDPAVTGGGAPACGRPRWSAELPDLDAGPVEPEVVDPDGAAPCIRTRLDDRLTVSGPVHLDDTPRIDVSWVRTGRVTTAASEPDGRPSVAVLTARDVGADGGALAVAAPLDLPTSLTAAADDRPRCRVRGPTLLRFDGGTVRVRSPLSHPRHDADGVPPVSCPGIDRTGIDGVVVLGPGTSDIIEVQRAVGIRCADHPLAIDPTEDAVAEQRCTAGTAYVWGDTTVTRTILTEDDVQIVWDVGTAVDGSDPARLGLVAGGSVVLRRPVGPPLRVVAPFGSDVAFAGPDIAPFGAFPSDAPTPVPTRWDAPRVQAVVAALGGSVRVQNPQAGGGSDTPIVIEGAVVQRFVGPTGWDRRDATGALQARTGRPLTVVHDRRLEVAVPPALPRIRGGRLRVLAWGEVRATGSGDGP